MPRTARFVLFSAVLAGSLAGLAGPAVAAPDLPPLVGVHNGEDGLCVTVSLQVPFCVDAS